MSQIQTKEQKEARLNISLSIQNIPSIVWTHTIVATTTNIYTL